MRRPNNDKIRILLIIRWPLGGIRTYIRYIYRNFDPSKYYIIILAPDIPELRILLDDLKGFNVTYIHMNPEIRTVQFFNDIFKTIMMNKNFDLIHSHGLTAGVCAAIPSYLKRKKHIMTVHDVFNYEQFYGVLGRMKKILINMILPLIDIINPVSHDAKENLVQHIPMLKLIIKRIMVIPNGIEVERFIGTDKRDFRKELKISDDTFLIGFLGRFMSQKGFCYLIQALKLLYSKYDLKKKPLILAFGEGGFIREEMALIEKEGLEKCVFFLPFTPNVASAIKGLDVIAMPSLWEACGLLAMESMAAGIPLIATDVIGLREVLNDTPAKKIPPKDSCSLAEALFEEMVNPTKDIFQEFQAEAITRFDVKKRSEEIEAIMLDLLKQNKQTNN